jgi:hypothetical protein
MLIGLRYKININGRVDLDDGNYPPQAWCVDMETDSWSIPYSSIYIYLVHEYY